MLATCGYDVTQASDILGSTEIFHDGKTTQLLTQNVNQKTKQKSQDDIIFVHFDRSPQRQNVMG